MDVCFHKKLTVQFYCYIKDIIPFITPVEYLILSWNQSFSVYWNQRTNKRFRKQSENVFSTQGFGNHCSCVSCCTLQIPQIGWFETVLTFQNSSTKHVSGIMCCEQSTAITADFEDGEWQVEKYASTYQFQSVVHLVLEKTIVIFSPLRRDDRCDEFWLCHRTRACNTEVANSYAGRVISSW